MRVPLGYPTLLITLAVLCTGPPQARGQQPLHLNKMIRQLADGQVVTGPRVDNKSPDGAVRLARTTSAHFLVYDMEHAPFDVPEMRVFLQFLLDPATIAGGRRTCR